MYSSEFEVLPESLVLATLSAAKAAFPRFGEWRYCNQDDGWTLAFCDGSYRNWKGGDGGGRAIRIVNPVD